MTPEGAAAEAPPKGEWLTKDVYLIYRDYIKHEDTLVHFRLNWLLVLTAMMLTAYLTLFGLILFSSHDMLQGAIESDNVRILFPSGLLFIPLLLMSLSGIAAATGCFLAIVGAARTARSVEKKWRQFLAKAEPSERDRALPDVTFGFVEKFRPIYGYPKVICVSVGVIWLTSLFADAYLLGYYHSLGSHG